MLPAVGANNDGGSAVQTTEETRRWLNPPSRSTGVDGHVGSSAGLRDAGDEVLIPAMVSRSTWSTANPWERAKSSADMRVRPPSDSNAALTHGPFTTTDVVGPAGGDVLDERDQFDAG